MKSSVRMIAIVICMLFCSSARAFDPAKLPARGPDEPTSYTYNKRFSLDEALQSVHVLRKVLEAFDRLMHEIPKYLPKEAQDRLELPSGEERTLGFFNWPNIIEGTLLKQNYQIRQLEHDLALERSRHQKIETKELDSKKAALAQAEIEFLKFWNSFGIAD